MKGGKMNLPDKRQPSSRSLLRLNSWLRVLDKVRRITSAQKSFETEDAVPNSPVGLIIMTERDLAAKLVMARMRAFAAGSAFLRLRDYDVCNL